MLEKTDTVQVADLVGGVLRSSAIDQKNLILSTTGLEFGSLRRLKLVGGAHAKIV